MKAAPKGSAPSFNGDKRKAYAHYERLVAKLSKANAAIGGYLAYGTICGPDGVKLVLAHLDRIGDMSRDQALRWAKLSADWLVVKVGESERRGKVLGD